jgi:hypothetical protein
MSIPPVTPRPPQEAVALELNRRRRKFTWRPCRHAGKARAFSEAGAISHVIAAVAALCPVERHGALTPDAQSIRVAQYNELCQHFQVRGACGNRPRNPGAQPAYPWRRRSVSSACCRNFAGLVRLSLARFSIFQRIAGRFWRCGKRISDQSASPLTSPARNLR